MTSKIAPDERRRHPRGEVLATAVVLAGNGSSGVYLVKNLSLGGALLLGDARWKAGEQVTVFLHLPGRQPLSLSAQVLPRGLSAAKESLFAVHFKQVAAETEDILQKVVQAALESHRVAPPHEVLVIDDSSEVRRALQRDLRALGECAVLAATPLDAVDCLNEARNIDTAIVDLRLGHADGLEFLCFLAEAHPSIRRVLMSGNIRPGQLELAIVSGRAHAVLEKPWSRKGLGQVIASGVPSS